MGRKKALDTVASEVETSPSPSEPYLYFDAMSRRKDQKILVVEGSLIFLDMIRMGQGIVTCVNYS